MDNINLCQHGWIDDQNLEKNHEKVNEMYCTIMFR